MNRFLTISICLTTLISCQQKTDKLTEIKAQDSITNTEAESKSQASVEAEKTTDLKSEDSTVSFEYVYPYNTTDLIENHYIVITKQTDKMIGRYYGTSDEFDPNREGYLPGFFVADMLDFQLSMDSIKFRIKLSNGDMFTKAVDLVIRSSDQARDSGYQEWGKGQTREKYYEGLILGDTIMIADDIGTRHYIKQTKTN